MANNFNMNMNQMTMMNNMQMNSQMNTSFNQMNNFPMKGVKNITMNMEYSHANSVLISLACLDSIKTWFKQLNSNYILYNNQFLITKEFYQILNNLYSGFQVDSSSMIMKYENKFRYLKNKESDKDPYHFLFYFLDYIHSETNNPINPNFDRSQLDNLQNMKNANYMYNLFGSYFQQALNSIVSQCFYNIEKNTFNCPNCSMMTYYNSRKIVSLNVDQYKISRNQEKPDKMYQKLDLEECFDYYTRVNNSNCSICKNVGASSKSIFSSTKILIIYFNRQNHIYDGNIGNNIKGDINFQLEITFLNKRYALKACISYCNLPKYFTDVYINNNWYRYMEDQIKVINISELYDYEPQLLIYELIDYNNFQINIHNSSSNSSNNMMFINPFNYNINQMMSNNNFNNIVFTPAYQYQQMLIQKQLQMQQQQQMMQTFQFYNQMMMNNSKVNMINNDNTFIPHFNISNNNNQNSNSPFLTLDFWVVPKNWDKVENTVNHKIKVQITLEDSIEKAIDNFYIKVQKKKEAITEFKFNDNTLDVKSKEKLKDSGFAQNSKIIAIQSDNFDNLNLFAGPGAEASADAGAGAGTDAGAGAGANAGAGAGADAGADAGAGAGAEAGAGADAGQN